MDFIKGFLNGEWMAKAKIYVNNPDKMRGLLNDVSKYVSKDGLRDVKDNIVLMYEYLRDILNGTYKDYDGLELAKIVGGLIYVVTPLDLIPDILPGGFIDDAAVIVWVYNSTMSELNRYKASRRR